MIEVTTKYATTVSNLTEAWSFIMEHIDKVGLFPSVNIHPIWIFKDNEEYKELEVSVEGTIEKE